MTSSTGVPSILGTVSRMPGCWRGGDERPVFCLHGHLIRLQALSMSRILRHPAPWQGPSAFRKQLWDIGPKLESLDELKEQSPLALTQLEEGRSSIFAIDLRGQCSKVERLDPCLTAHVVEVTCPDSSWHPYLPRGTVAPGIHSPTQRTLTLQFPGHFL